MAASAYLISRYERKEDKAEKKAERAADEAKMEKLRIEMKAERAADEAKMEKLRIEMKAERAADKAETKANMNRMFVVTSFISALSSFAGIAALLKK